MAVNKDNWYSPVGNGDVIKMEYVIMIGPFDNEPTELLAWTESFTEGISLSEIKWGYVNTSDASGEGLGSISFTLHDIAGITLANFIKLRRGTHYIHFKGPMSNGELYPSAEWAMYFPVEDQCKIEFSATQGFTYTFVGNPIVQLTKTKSISAADIFTITGATEAIAPSSTFKDYLNLVVKPMWNTQITKSENPDKKSLINNFEFISDDKLSYEDNPAQVILKDVDATSGHLEPFGVSKGMTIDSLVTGLFNERFKKPEDFPNKPKLEVNFVKWEGEGHTIQVRFLDKKVQTVTTDIPICIGDDKNCAGQFYRGQLVNISFNNLVGQFASIADGYSSPSDDTVQGGNVSKAPIATDATDTIGVDHKDSKRAVQPYTSIPMGQGSAAMWGQLNTYLQGAHKPEFTVDVELPFSFGFTPVALGGLLKDSIEGGTGIGIHYTQGAKLLFFWYDDPHCQKLVLHPTVSQDYRITTVSHTIGLNGNTTQLGLSHLHITE